MFEQLDKMTSITKNAHGSHTDKWLSTVIEIVPVAELLELESVLSLDINARVGFLLETYTHTFRLQSDFTTILLGLRSYLELKMKS